MKTNEFSNYTFNSADRFDGLTPLIMEQLPTTGGNNISQKLGSYNGAQSLEVIDFNALWPEPSGDNHEYVDLGLPSGTKWATENIRNSNGEELYFAWGETQGYTSGQVGTDKYFAWDGEHADYEFGEYDDRDENYGMTRYNNTDGLSGLTAEDDAATVNWGSNWRMPTKEEFDELTANTTAEQTEVDGVVGWLFTSTVEGYTDKSIFFPAVGGAVDGDVGGIGGCGYCWSSSLYVDDVSNAWRLDFGSKGVSVDHDNRFVGYTVRPVRS